MHFETHMDPRLLLVIVIQVCLIFRYMNRGSSLFMYFSHFTQPSRGLTTSVPGQRGTLIQKNSDTVKTFNHIVSYVITL